MATAKKKRPTRGATRSPEKKGMPASVMLGTGFIAGVLSTVLVFNMMNERAPAAPEQDKRAEKVEPAPPTKKTTTTKFDFFTVLPEREVIVPDETPQPARKPKVVANEAPPPEDDSKRYQSGERYILQAGSFRNNEDADRRRAQILLLGLDAKVELVEANGDRWHRVYVGPFLTHNTLSSARSKLINESIDTLVIRQKTP